MTGETMNAKVRHRGTALWLALVLALVPATVWAANFSGPIVFGLMMTLPIALPLGTVLYFLLLKHVVPKPGIKPWAGSVLLAALGVVLVVIQACDPDPAASPTMAPAQQEDAATAP